MIVWKSFDAFAKREDCLKSPLKIAKGGRKFIDGPDTGYSISCQNKNKFLGFCKLSIIELKLLTGISLNTVMMIMMTMLMVSVKVTVMDRLVAELALPCNTGWPNFFHICYC